MKIAFEWEEKYNTGVLRIDHQHQYFLQLINWLTDSLLASEDVDLNRKYIEEVMRYAKFHFLSEENIMQYYAYPEYEDHRNLHSKIVNQLNIGAANLDFGEENIGDFVKFLSGWFFEHTAEEDMKIGIYLKGRKYKV
jgi:hemerythrin